MQKYIFTFFLLFTSIFSDDLDFEHNGWERECYIYKPSCIPDEPSEDFESLPLVIMFHGLGAEGVDYYGISPVAEDSCFIVAFPSGVYNTWNIGPGASYSHDIDDVDYLDALIDSILTLYPVDSNRVYASGHSMGAAMTNNLACRSNRFAALGASGGWLNPSYNYGNEDHYLCDPLTDTYTTPIIITHGASDTYVPVEWAGLAAYHWALNNRCHNVPTWSNFVWPDYWDLNLNVDNDTLAIIIPEILGSADSSEFTVDLQRYQWSYGCSSEPSVQLVFVGGHDHYWHMPDNNSPINTVLEHWNFMSQFSKDKIGPTLDSLLINDGDPTITIDDLYENTPIRIFAGDNHGVDSLILSLSGFVTNFEIIMTFSDNKFINIDSSITLSSDISTDNYEITEIEITDSDGNSKLYDQQDLQLMGIGQQLIIINSTTNTIVDGPLTPEGFTLHQNYPNPFNPETNINYDIPEDGLVSISIYNMRGTLVKTLVNKNQASGFRTVKWDGTNKNGQVVSAGLYMYQIKINDYLETKKMALLK